MFAEMVCEFTDAFTPWKNERWNYKRGGRKIAYFSSNFLCLDVSVSISHMFAPFHYHRVLVFWINAVALLFFLFIYSVPVDFLNIAHMPAENCSIYKLHRESNGSKHESKWVTGEGESMTPHFVIHTYKHTNRRTSHTAAVLLQAL